MYRLSNRNNQKKRTPLSDPQSVNVCETNLMGFKRILIEERKNSGGEKVRQFANKEEKHTQNWNNNGKSTHPNTHTLASNLMTNMHLIWNSNNCVAQYSKKSLILKSIIRKLNKQSSVRSLITSKSTKTKQQSKNNNKLGYHTMNACP